MAKLGSGPPDPGRLKAQYRTLEAGDLPGETWRPISFVATLGRHPKVDRNDRETVDRGTRRGDAVDGVLASTAAIFRTTAGVGQSARSSRRRSTRRHMQYGRRYPAGPVISRRSGISMMGSNISTRTPSSLSLTMAKCAFADWSIVSSHILKITKTIGVCTRPRSTMWKHWRTTSVM